MRILVTGKKGQVASCLHEIAPSIGHEIISIGRPEIDFANCVNIEAIIARISPDIIINAAAYTLVDKAETDTLQALKINGEFPKLLATNAKKLNIPIIHLSTDYVYSGGKTSPYLESDALGPVNIYGETKLLGERGIIANYSNYVIVRTSWVYSPFGENFVKTMLKIAKSNDNLNIVCDQIGCPTYAFEIAKTLLEIASRIVGDSSENLRGIFNYCGANPTNWADFAEEIFNQAELEILPTIQKITSSEYKTAAKRPNYSVLNCEKIAKTYSIAQVDWKKSLKECIKYIKGK